MQKQQTDNNCLCPVIIFGSIGLYINFKEIKDTLLKQLFALVRWTQSVQHMLADGMTEFVECGPGTVLKGLIGRIQKSL